MHIEPCQRLADPAKLRLVLQHNGFGCGHRQIERRLGQIAIGQLALRCHMDDMARLGGQFTHRHAQLRRTRLHQHRARGRADAPHGGIARPDRIAAPGHAAARACTHDLVIGPGGSVFDHEPCRIGIEFFADDLRHGGKDALAPFDKRALQADGAIAPDFEECRHARAWHYRRALRARRAGRQAKAQHECPRRGPGRGHQKPAARNVDRRAGRQRPVVGQIGNHAACSRLPATSCTAARIVV